MKKLINYTLLFCILIVGFSILTIITYLLPNNSIRKNIRESISIFESEKTYYYGSQFYGYPNNYAYSVKLDNFTDSIIMQVAMDCNSDKESLLNRAFSNNFLLENNITPLNSLKSLLDGKENNSKYTRYWFGTIPILRVLFEFFSYQEIRYINVFIFTVLLLIVIKLIHEKLSFKMALAFIMSIIPTGMIIIPMSLQYMPVYIITFISLIVLFNFYTNTKFNIYIYFFIVGAITAYLDLLTFPLITLGIPLIFYILLENKYNVDNNKIVCKVIKSILLWCISYILTFLSHWIIAFFITDTNAIKVAVGEAMYRIGNKTSDYNYSRFFVIWKNSSIYFNKIIRIMIIFYLLVFLKKFYKNPKITIKLPIFISIIIVSLMPYAWYFIIANHSLEHFWMTYRIQMITMMSLLSISIIVTTKSEKEGVANEERK